MVFVSANAVEVVNEMVALLPVPTAVVKMSEGLEMAPIAETVAYAAVLSVDVSIFNPVEPPAVATNSGFADNVSPVHVIPTKPAGSVDPVARVIVTFPLSENLDVDVTADDVMTHRLSAWAVTYPGGKLRVIWFADDGKSAVEVLNEIEAVPPVPTDLLMVNCGSVMTPVAGIVT